MSLKTIIEGKVKRHKKNHGKGPNGEARQGWLAGQEVYNILRRGWDTLHVVQHGIDGNAREVFGIINRRRNASTCVEARWSSDIAGSDLPTSFRGLPASFCEDAVSFREDVSSFIHINTELQSIESQMLDSNCENFYRLMTLITFANQRTRH